MTGEVGYTYTFQVTDVTITSNLTYLNFEAGYKHKLSQRIFLQPSLLVNKNIATYQKESGTLTQIQVSGYLTGPGAPANYYYSTVTPIKSSHKFSGNYQASVRLTAFYQFKIRNLEYSVFAFRNFSLDHVKLPWWGLGIGLIF